MSMASEDCASDHHPFLSEPLETKAIVAAEEGFLGDVGVHGEVVSNAKIPPESTGIKEDETVQEQCGSSDPMEIPVQGVRTEENEKDLIQEVDSFLTENEAADGETKEAGCGDEGTEEAPIEALEEEPIENSRSNGASDTAPDSKIIQAKVSDEEELVKPPEYQEENIKITKAEVVEDPSVENVATDTMASKSEKQLTEEESEYNLDQEKENESLIGIEAEDNAVVENVGRENIVSDTPLAEGEGANENGVKEQIKDRRAGPDPEPEEKLIVEDAANEIIPVKETERVAGSMDGTGNDDSIEYTIPTPEPPNASEVVTKKPSVTTSVLNGEGNARKEQGKGKESGKLMSRVKSSLGKVRKTIIRRPSPSSKTIVVDARLEEKVQ